MRKNLVYLLLTVLLVQNSILAQNNASSDVINTFRNPPEMAKPWVFWYWMHAAISKKGITADLEAMKQVGIGGAYLMPIKDTSSSIPFSPAARQLSPEWWEMVKFAMQEAKRLKLKLAMHVSDGFALAGGPWITPELSMQKLVWTKTFLKAGTNGKIKLDQPSSKENYYKDVVVYAYPAELPLELKPEVTTSAGLPANYLSDPKGNQSFRSDTNCWIQYQYSQPFTCRSVTIHVGGNNYQAQRLIVQSSNDGVNFNVITRLQPPRHGWQDTDEDYTYSLVPTTALYFRFVYSKEGSEPGSEDLDAAKWKPSFKVNGIYLSEDPVINQYQAKNGSIWRVANNTTANEVSEKEAVALNSVIDISNKMDHDGNLIWSPPPNEKGGWMIVRIGNTSTGHTNYTGGAGLGLECDKFNPVAVKLQFENWFAKAFEKTDPSLAKEVLKIFHIDSWECGSQNWSPLFLSEFKKRRGYDLKPWLLVMTGVPVGDAKTSEKVLHDVRQTISELVYDNFYRTLAQLAHSKGVSFNAEAIAPTMVGDGLLHYKAVDFAMGEFWLNSPTHDKPNDMRDAISGGHIYGKRIIQSESFTSVRMNWAEHPGNLKIVGDRNFALGVNKLVLHVFAHNPWMDKKPGMTLDGVGLYFQRDQTWFKQGKAWNEYLTRTSALLQLGTPVTDIAVFTGEEIPRRAILPERLINTLPGIIGSERLEADSIRRLNIGQPMRQIPDGVSHSANMADPEDWIDPLRGYAYDSFNPDALMMMSVRNGKVVLPGGASYAVLVFPGWHPMQPNYKLISESVARKILQLVNDGATILIHRDFIGGTGMKDVNSSTIISELFDGRKRKGKVILTPFNDSTFAGIGLDPDLINLEKGQPFGWTHRKSGNADIYFISNQENKARDLKISLRVSGKEIHVLDPVDGKEKYQYFTRQDRGRTVVELVLAAGESLFLIFEGTEDPNRMVPFLPPMKDPGLVLDSNWSIRFDAAYGGPIRNIVVNKLESWTSFPDSAIRYYSGTAFYHNQFNWKQNARERTWVQLDSVCNIASVKINGIACGTIWTTPYALEITHALKNGVNKIEIEVANTWHNRLIGDQILARKVTWTTAPFRLKGRQLLPAGIIGNVTLIRR